MSATVSPPPQASRNPFNPFRTNLNTPNPTGTNANESAGVAISATAAPNQTSSAPVVAVRPPSPSPGGTRSEEAFPSDLFEDPPPYTPNPSYIEGETSVERGPARPFQPPPRPPPPPVNAPSQASPDPWSRLQDRVVHTLIGPTSSSWNPPRPAASNSSRAGSLFQQVASTVQNVVQQLNTPQTTGLGNSNSHTAGHGAWSSYPGQQQTQHYNWTSQNSLSPPQPPRALSASASHSEFRNPSGLPPPEPTLRRHSSEFARDFYAAGTAEEAGLATEGSASSSLPPRPSSASASVRPHDAKPTNQPVAGHPLMNAGRVLVYPKGHKCEKCQNIGYKAADPSRPCNRCWSKYAKAYTGPVALSFNNVSDTQGESNLQRPLPYQPPSQPPPPASRPPGPPPRSSYNGPPGAFHRQPQHGGPVGNSSFWHPPPPQGPALPPRPIPSFGNRPPPGSIVLTAGDPRIGGHLCRRCNGKGNVSFLFERITCDVCNGVGRIIR